MPAHHDATHSNHLKKSTMYLNSLQKTFLYVLIACCTALPATATAATLSGTLPQSETWSGSIQLTGDVTVPHGMTLTIEAGTQLVFPADLDDTASGADSGHSELIIAGDLVAEGTAGSPVTFTSSAGSPAKGDWGGIRMSGEGTLTLSHAVVEYTTLGLGFDSDAGYGEVNISNSTFRYGTGNGIDIYLHSGNSRSVTISSSEVHDYDGMGMSLRASTANTVMTATVSNNTVHDTGDHGIYLHTEYAARSELSVTGNTVFSTANNGIYSYAIRHSTVVNGLFEGNTVFNTTQGIQLYNYYHATSESIIVKNNTIHDTTHGLLCQVNHHNASMSPVITDNTLYENSEHGIYVTANQGYSGKTIQTRIIHNTITNNAIGIKVFGGSGTTVGGTIALNTITGNTGQGIDFTGSDQALLLHNDIQGNGDNGLSINNSGPSLVYCNNLSDNSGAFELANNSAQAADARYNWWGDAITSQMDAGDNPKNISKIHDIFDDSSKGGVNYAEWLGTAQPMIESPTSWIIDPIDNLAIKKRSITIRGVALSAGEIERVEVSIDNGQTWMVVSGTERWSYEWNVPADGTYTIRSRVISQGGIIEQPGTGHTITIDSALLTTRGELISDENWNGEILLTGDVTVPAGVTLTIQEGATIHFQAMSDDIFSGSDNSRGELIIAGNLIAEGTGGSPITFTSSATTPAKDDWAGIRMSGEGTLTLSHVVVEYGSIGLSFDSDTGYGEVSISNSTFRYGTGNGIDIYLHSGNSRNITISSNEVHDYDGMGMSLRASTPNTVMTATVSNNTVHDTGDHGIYLHTEYAARSELSVTGNTVFSTANNGIYSYASRHSTVVNGLFEGNTVYNTTQGIQLYNYYNATSESIIVKNNTIHDTTHGLLCQVNHHNASMSPVITDNTLYENSEHGIYVTANQGYSGKTIQTRIIHNTITNNANGIRMFGGSGTTVGGTIALNTITGNTGQGIDFTGSDQALLLHNDIQGNGDNGLSINNSGPSSVFFNNLTANSGSYEFANNSASVVEARYNWWGDAITGQMDSGDNPKNITRIHDIFDDSSIGGVVYTDWLGVTQVLIKTPVSWIIDPVNNLTTKTQSITIRGVATSPAGIEMVEVSTDDGQTWNPASGTELWTYQWTVPVDGTYTLRSRAISLDGTIEEPGSGHTVTLDSQEAVLSGTIEYDEVWSGQIRLSGDVVVPEGMTLTILPGTEILMPTLRDGEFGGTHTSKSELIIHGTLLAEGTEAEPITLSSTNHLGGQPGDWGGITVNGSLYFKHVTLKNAETGIRFTGSQDGSHLSLLHSTITRNALHGIDILANNGATVSVAIQDSTITYNNGYGINCTAAQAETALSLDIRANTIAVNGDRAVNCYADGTSGDPTLTGTIRSNTIFDHLTHGIHLSTYHGALSELNIDSNEIYQSAKGIYGGYNQSSASSLLTVANNTLHDGETGLTIQVDKGTLSPVIEQNEFYNHINDGIYLDHDGQDGTILLPQVNANQMYDNDRYGIYLQVTAAITMTNNSMYDNGPHDLYNATSHAIDARGNWWGADTTNIINNSDNPANLSAIYDYHDSTDRGEVDYADWLLLYQTPTPPTLNEVTSPSNAATQTISGTKPAGAGIQLNSVLIVQPDESTNWSYELPLTEGTNSLALWSRSNDGMVSSLIHGSITRDTTAPQLYSSVPADSTSVSRQVTVIEMTLIEATTGIDPAATAQGSVRNQLDAEIPGTWAIDHNHLTFTPNTPLSDGTYTVTINPTDQPLGNTSQASLSFTVDAAPPAAPGLDPVTSPTKTRSVTISGTKESATAVLLDTTEITALNDDTAWAHTLTLREGVNTFSLVCRDRAGNSSETTSLTIILDQKAPILVATAPLNGSHFRTLPPTASFLFDEQSTTLDVDATLASGQIFNAGGHDLAGSWSVNDGNRVVFTPSQPFGEDSYTVRVTARDQVANATEAVFSFTYDATPPVAPSLEPVQSPTGFTHQTLSGTKEADSSIRLNGVEIVPLGAETTWTYQLTLVEGENNLTIDSADRAENISSAVTATIHYDETAPLSVNTLSVNTESTGSQALMDWTGYNEAAQGDVAYYRIYFRDSLFTQLADMTPAATVPAGTFTYTATNLTKDARYYFAVVAVDNKENGHTSVTPISGVIKDVEPPEPIAQLRAVNSGDTLNFSWTHSANSAGDLAGYSLVFNNGTPQELTPDTNSHTVTGLAAATGYPCSITSVDGDGNHSAPIQITGVTPLANPGGLTVTPYTGYVALSWNPVTPVQFVSHYTIYVSTTEFSSVAGMEPWQLSTQPDARVARLTNGTTYYFAVVAVNISGGYASQVSTVTATPGEDSEGPEIIMVRAGGELLTDGTALSKPVEITVEATDPVSVSRIEFKVDGAHSGTDYLPTPLYAWTFNIAQFGDGEHTLTIVAYDSLGNSSELDIQVTITLDPPEAPVWGEPQSGLLTNEERLAVSGSAEVDTTVTIISNSTAVATAIPVDREGLFSTEITLTEGENILTATSTNPAGTSAESSGITVTLDTSLPSGPTNLIGEAKASGQIKLGWRGPVGEQVTGYHVYRSSTAFTAKAAAHQLTSEPVASTTYTDLTPEDGEWFYRVATVDLAGNEGVLSDAVSIISDRVAPRALAINVEHHGQTNGLKLAPGLLDLRVSVNEPLKAVPFISIVPEGGSPYAVRMTMVDELTYTGSYSVEEFTPSGTAYILFSARDMAGNRGTEIDSGATLVFDTDGPTVTRLQVVPTAPLNNESQLEITATFGLDEQADPDGPPQFSYQLSGAGRTVTALGQAQEVGAHQGEAQAWQLSFQLPADGGLEAAETLSFLFQASDALGNSSTAIAANNQFQVYQGDLPPLETPRGFTAKAVAQGKVSLAWQPVDEAAGYRLFRRSEQETEPLAFMDLQSTEHLDTPPAEGRWYYGVASIRKLGEEEALSGLSNEVLVDTDITPPNPPQNLVLSLTPQGIKLEWQAPAGAESVSYALYRAATTEITSVEGLEPLVTGIEQTMVIDPTPSASEHCYVITAMDAIGNESAPSNSAYQNFELLPVANITIVQESTELPVLSWEHPNHSSLAGYKVYLEQNGSTTLLTSDPLNQQTYVDSGFAGYERQYSLVAVDEHGVESMGHSLLLPRIHAELLPDTLLERGIINHLTYRVKNLGTSTVANIRLSVEIGSRVHLSEVFTLSGGEYSLIPLIVGGYDDLPDLAEATVTTEIRPNAGELVQLVRHDYVDVRDGMLLLQLGNEEFLRGGNGKVWFRLENSGQEEIEIITATAAGTRDSSTIRYEVVDSDGNVLVTAPFRQFGTSDLVTLSNSNVVARIPAGEAFTSLPTEIHVPSGVPEELTVRLIIDTISYHQTREDEVVMQGLAGELPLVLVDTTYYGEISNVAPAVSTGDEDIIITGRAIERESGISLGLVPLKLTITVEGYERTVEVETDEVGAFSYAFTPLEGESGTFEVRVVHPDLLDKPVQATFVITRVIIDPTSINLRVPRNYEQEMPIAITTGVGTELNNLRLVYTAEDQEGGVLPEGIHLTPGETVIRVEQKEQLTLPLSIWADNLAAETGTIVLRVVSDESGPEGWGLITINTTFSTATPVLDFHPATLETGVVQDGVITETITLTNKGFAALEQVVLSITELDGAAAPAWVRLNIRPELGDIEIGAERDVPISFSPDQSVAPGAYQFILNVESANYTSTPIYLFAIVDQDGQGHVLFKVADIYTGTSDGEGGLVEGLAGATITLQNEDTLVSQPDLVSDALGEAEFQDLPAGWYKYRITARNHQEQIGRLLIKPGLTATRDIFLEYNLVTVSWEVNEITIEDRYEVVLTATYESDVPAPVVIAEPSSLTLPALKAGMVMNGEFTLTNHGLIRADNLGFSLPGSDSHFKFELLAGMPDSLEAKQTITVPYRVTCLKSPDQEAETGGGCYSYRACISMPYTYQCVNGTQSGGSTTFCWTYTYGSCSGTGVIGSGGTSYGYSPGGSSSAMVPVPQRLSGAKCLPRANKETPPCPLPSSSNASVQL